MILTDDKTLKLVKHNVFKKLFKHQSIGNDNLNTIKGLINMCLFNNKVVL